MTVLLVVGTVWFSVLGFVLILCRSAGLADERPGRDRLLLGWDAPASKVSAAQVLEPQ